MKTTLLVSLAALSALLTIPPASAQAVNGSTLNIGTTPQASGDKSGAVGASNNVISGNSFAVGDHNEIYGWEPHTGNAAFGYYNSIAYAFSSAAIGGINSVHAAHSLAVGVQNTLAISANGLNAAYASLAVGSQNYVNYSVSNAFVTGVNNYADIGSANSTLGHGLINKWNDATVVGHYNDSTVTAPLLFAVGNGADANNRSNAFEVRADGKVLMPRQGDIKMGAFGNPNSGD